MKALVYDGPGKIEYRDHPRPKLDADTDIIMKISHSTICGTDLHIIKGGVPTVQPGTVLGHEATGVVNEVGNSVQNVKVGDRILAVCVSACGYCRFCTSAMYGLPQRRLGPGQHHRRCAGRVRPNPVRPQLRLQDSRRALR